MLQGGEHVLVAVSGGVDSMTLLNVLLELAEDWHLTLSVAHLDHRMRSGSADDARFVADGVKALRLPFVQNAVDVPAYVQREGGSPEAGARDVRYRFLREAAHETGASAIALGHTLDDRVETLFINLLRGAGIQGLAGMPPVRAERDLRYIRPLIDSARARVEAYADSHGIPYRDDPSNRDPRYERNRVRHELMPLLETFNPNVRGAVGRANEALADLQAYLHRDAERLLSRALIASTNQAGTWDAQPLRAAHRALQRQALRQAIVHVKADIQGITEAHIDALADLLEQARSGRSVDLPGDVSARYHADRLIVEHGRGAPSEAPPVQVGLRQSGTTDVPQLGWRFRVDEMPGSHPDPADRLEARVDAGTMVGPLAVRNRRPGDRMRPLGLGGTKKLQDILVDAKIPRHQRDAIPLICDDHGILWVTGQCRSERAHVTPHTRMTLRIRAERIVSEENR